MQGNAAKKAKWATAHPSTAAKKDGTIMQQLRATRTHTLSEATKTAPFPPSPFASIDVGVDKSPHRFAVGKQKAAPGLSSFARTEAEGNQ